MNTVYFTFIQEQSIYNLQDIDFLDKNIYKAKGLKTIRPTSNIYLIFEH